jgi:hypothetical protein
MLIRNTILIRIKLVDLLDCVLFNRAGACGIVGSFAFHDCPIYKSENIGASNPPFPDFELSDAN